MKRRKTIPALFAVLGGCLAAMALVICLTQRDAEPALLVYPEAAEDCTENLLSSVCSGDFQSASQYLYDQPSLGTDGVLENAASQYIWDAFVSSLDYQFQSDCYATFSGVARDVTVVGLDVEQILLDMEELEPQLLEDQVNQAEDMDAVYDAEQEYREDFIQSVMYLAAQTALAEATPTTRSLTLNLIYDAGTWWVVPDSELLNAVSGGILE